ncbi:MAG: hypothetical protein JWL60_2493, partial [Gemmatimonadetes bacterium]|nr:hypothetical protein [Gemmatimonadota bacterium]
LEPLRAGLLALDTLAPAAAEGGRASAGWALWVEQLKRVFSAADIACHGVARVLAQVADVPAPAARRWSPFRPGGSGR